MIKLELLEKTYELPSDWSEVNIDDYIKIYRLTQDIQNMSKIEYMLSVISELTGIEYDVLETVKISDITNIFEHINFVNLNTIPSLVVNEIKINDDVYTLKDFKNLSLGEFITLDSDITNNLIENIPAIMAVLYSKNGEEFKDTNHKENIETFKTVGIDKVYGTLLFFWSIVDKHSTTMKLYSEVEVMTVKMERMVKMKIWNRWKGIKKYKKMIDLGFGLVRFYIWRKKTLLKLKQFI